ncbi:MAG TPA: DUF4910 domain-containing protein [Oculatellaceae cyanobacterium]
MHSNVGYFGYPEEGADPKSVFDTIYGAFCDVLGDGGTLVVPTFSYSFCYGQPYDPLSTPSTCGFFTEMLRCSPKAQRSTEPIHSVAAIGRHARDLTCNVSAEGFGIDSFWDRFYKADGVVCNLNLDAGSTFIHYVERSLNVPYRYDKIFTGDLIVEGKAERRHLIYFCRDMHNPGTIPAFELFDQTARDLSLAKTASVGRGQIVFIKSSDVYDLIRQMLLEDPWSLTASAGCSSPPILVRPTPAIDDQEFTQPLNALVDRLTRTRREPVSDGYDVALAVLARGLAMNSYLFPTGTRLGELIVPEKWTCQQAYIESEDGRRWECSAGSELDLAGYSQSFTGKIAAKQFNDHLIISPLDRCRYVSLMDERDWSICCTDNIRRELSDEEYTVKIDTKFEFGQLKVGEVMLSGESPRQILIVASPERSMKHGDGLVGAAVASEIMKRLASGGTSYWSYRFIFLPSWLGVHRWLEHAKIELSGVQGLIEIGELNSMSQIIAKRNRLLQSDFVDFCERSLLGHGVPVLDHSNDDSWYGTVQIQSEHNQGSALDAKQTQSAVEQSLSLLGSLMEEIEAWRPIGAPKLRDYPTAQI